MAEWFKAPVLKTGDAQASVGSNPTLSANQSAGSSCLDVGAADSSGIQTPV